MAAQVQRLTSEMLQVRHMYERLDKEAQASANRAQLYQAEIDSRCLEPFFAAQDATRGAYVLD